jgi:hypothetical protein
MANNVDKALVNAESAARLRSVIVALPHIEFIMQRNAETQPLLHALECGDLGPLPANVSFLFDESKGTGVVAAEWPTPPLGPFGYAGGLGPKTLEAQLRKMVAKITESAAAAGREFWVDMESSLRTLVVEKGAPADAPPQDVFDVAKCTACVLIVEAAAREGVLAMPN